MQRCQFVGLLEADAASGSLFGFVDAVLGASSAERLQLVACGHHLSDELPREPHLGDELATIRFERSQRAIAAVTVVHGEQLSARRLVAGFVEPSLEDFADRALSLGGDVLVVPRGPLLEGLSLSRLVGRAQMPSCVVAQGFAGRVRKIAVAVDLEEGTVQLVERALVLASQLGVELVPVHAVLADAAGDRRNAVASVSKRFEQLMGQVELAFGAAYATRNLLQPLEVVRGETVEALQLWASASPVDLVVVGSSSPDRSRLSLGQVATALVGSFPVALWVEQLGDRTSS